MRPIIEAIADENQKLDQARPVLIKLAPDLADEDAHAVAELALETQCAGLVVSNTTIRKEGLASKVPEGSGGISGRPVFVRSTEMLKALTGDFTGKLSFIGVGGIENADTCRRKLDAGADLVQVYTGFVYAGPGFVRALCRALKARADA